MAKRFFILSSIVVFCLGTGGLAFAGAIEIPGALQDKKSSPQDYKLVQESLIIKDGRVYIYVWYKQTHSAAVLKRFLLPYTIGYDEGKEEIFYVDEGGGRIPVGHSKKFLGLIPYIALCKGVKILSSPYEAKLYVPVEEEGVFVKRLKRGGRRKDMDTKLSEKCSQCHVLEYIYSHKEWSEEDCLHVFNRLKRKGPVPLTEDEQRLINKFLAYQRKEIKMEDVKEFKELHAIGRKDVKDVAKEVYNTTCAPCHSPDKAEEITSKYSKKRCASIVSRMQAKDPSLILEADTDSLATYLWELKMRPRKERRGF
jgi:hypothetical protein